MKTQGFLFLALAALAAGQGQPPQLNREAPVTSVPFERAFASGGASRFLRTVEGFSFGLARVWKKLFAYQFVVTAVQENGAIAS